MSKFWELLEESIIVQSIITLLVIGAIVYLALTKQAVPELLAQLALLIIGFYFGSKGQITSQRAADAAIRKVTRGRE